MKTTFMKNPTRIKKLPETNEMAEREREIRLHVAKSEIKPGRWIRLYFEDTGCHDAIVLEMDGNLRVFIVGECTFKTAEFDQVVAVGPWLNVPKF